MIKKIFAACMVSCFLSGLISCGQTGKLYLPEAKTSTSTPTGQHAAH